jgi:hypothetical protein
MLSISLKVPLEGSYTSALAVGEFPAPTNPPTIKTVPSASRVAVCRRRDVIMLPVGMNEPVEGSNSSALAVPPPAIRTFPFWSRVAVCPDRAVIMSPVAVNAPGDCANATAALRRNIVFISHLLILPIGAAP